jgi:sigma-B regulation protein RsbU (phosphoserine phosphatase)
MVVDRALDVGVVLRQGLQYGLARNGVFAVQVLISGAVVFSAFSLASDPGANRPRRIQFIASGLAVVFLTQVFAARLRVFIDRRFFREALDTERLLTELGEDVRSIVETPALLDATARRLSDALHVPRVAVFLKRDAGYALAQAVGLGAPAEVSLDEGAAVLERLRQEARPITVYPEDPHHWAHGIPERETLVMLRSQVLVPLLLKARLLGFLSLGPKLSEQPYSPSDLRLLGSVGAQVALALENTRLTAAVAAEVATRERMNRELEIAREVQERLFPQDPPDVPGLEYAGFCRPARGVGGDYYDFLALSRTRLGLAIGDVSGKGIPAALLMASLQASLRGQVTFGPADLAEVMGRVNHLICDSSSANRYATFFYAQFDPEGRTLAYVNAGHNAPMLLRKGGRVERLEEGGPVVGLIEIAGYQAAQVQLEPGDRLLAYTDGLSEAMNPAEEEWGEERLLAAFRDCDGLPAAEAIRRLIASADAFAAGAPQHDDMTVLVARFLS